MYIYADIYAEAKYIDVVCILCCDDMTIIYDDARCGLLYMYIVIAVIYIFNVMVVYMA
jgi:hypothetical protein